MFGFAFQQVPLPTSRRAPPLPLPSCDNVTYLMTPAESRWTNICVLVVLVFVRDGLHELQRDTCRPAEENPAGLFGIGFLRIAPLTVPNNLKNLLQCHDSPNR